jgi:hypothetical protein
MHTPDRGSFTWRKSSYSSDQANCVEVAVTEELVGVRDSKDPEGGALELRTDHWRRFLREL